MTDQPPPLGNEPALPIEDYAMIGDCRSAALVGRNGSIDWLCWPRFDSEPCLAALLGTPENGRWQIAPIANGARSERRYRPETMVLETDFVLPAEDGAGEGRVTVTDFMPTESPNSSVVRTVTGQHGVVRMAMQLVLRFDCGLTVPWVEKLPEGDGIVAIAGPSMVTLRADVPIHGTDHRTEAEFEVREGESVTFVLTYGASHLPPPAAIDHRTALAGTEEGWRHWTQHCNLQGRYRDAVIRSLLTLKAMTFHETGGMVAAVTTSLPEHLGGERNWDYRFCWLRDVTISLLALMQTGFYEEAICWRDWLHRSVAGNAEQMQIMYGLAGERRMTEWEVDWLPGYQGAKPVRIGNAAASQLQLDVFGEVMSALHLARANRLAEPEQSWALQCEIMAYLETIWRRPDEGIWEVRGQPQQFTFSKVMCWVAFDRAIDDAEKYGLEAPLDRWRALRDEIHALVCAKGFDPALNSFTQTFGCRNFDASLLLIGRVGFLPPDDPRMLGTIAAVEQNLLRDGFVMRYRADTGIDGLAGDENAFLACSFWLAGAYHAAGKPEKARQLFERLLGLCNDVGLLSEEYDPHNRRFTGNFPQAFSHVALVICALQLSGDVVPPA